MANLLLTIVWPGWPYPLGSTWDGEGVNFALYPEHAEKVELCIFNAWNDSNFGYRVGHKREDLSFDRRDNAVWMPKNRVIDSAFTWGADAPPRIPWHETVIYELHVKGSAQCNPDVPQRLRGIYAGLATAPIIEYLTRLGGDFHRTHAGARLRGRSPTCGAWFAQLLGL